MRGSDIARWVASINKWHVHCTLLVSRFPALTVSAEAAERSRSRSDPSKEENSVQS
jgi:hypothetical protein